MVGGTSSQPLRRFIESPRDAMLFPVTAPSSHSPADASVLKAFHDQGGLLFPFLQGYERLGEMLDRMPPDAWRRDDAVLGGLVLYLVKHGQSRRAKSYLTAVDLDFEKSERFTILELLLALHLGGPVSEAQLRRWRRLERTLPISEPLLLGLYYNAMTSMLVRLGHQSEARITAQQAISCYRGARHLYLEHFMHIHMADLDVVQGRLHRAQQALNAAETCLDLSGTRYGNEREIIAVVRLAIDYERGELDRVRQRTGALRAALVGGDSWSELFFQLARIGVLSAYFLEGRDAALTELGLFEADYALRHMGEARALEALKALIWHLEWQPDAAERALEQLRESPIQSALGEMLASEVEATLGLVAHPLPEGPRGGMVAALRQARTARGRQRQAALERALRLAADTGQIAPFLEHRDVFMGFRSTLARGRTLSGPGRMGRVAARVQRLVSDSYVVPEALARLGFNRRQYRVTAALMSGATNKQIARQLGISEGTVKYHLGSLYRLAGVGRRKQFIDFVGETGAFP